MRLRMVGRDLEIDWDDPALRITPAQRRAMATDRELVVTAGAGTGKTHTLALRYVALQLKLANAADDDVERVVVLTFTEKAAHEMTERCRARLAAVAEAARAHRDALDADEPGRGTAIVAALDARVDGFDRARIGTFHGFCARIVREYPAETETPPGMALLDPVEATRRVTETLASTLLGYVARHPDDLAPLLDAFGTRRALLEAGRTALDRLSVLAPTLEAHAAGEVTVDDALAAARPTPAEAERWVATVGWPSLQLLARLVAPSGGGPFVEGTLVPALRDPALATPGADPLAVYARYRAVLDLLMTEEGTLRRLDHSSVLGRKERWPDARRYEQAKEASRALTTRLGDWEARARAARTLPTSADRALLEALRPFARWLLEADRALGAASDRDRVLTFEQLQRRVVRAVTGRPELARALRERFRYVMVDEFQDTDEAQWSMVRALARAAPDVPEDRVFVVGDPKQAIYGFRGGDVTVFRAATLALGVEPIALLDNFRSRPGLIRWFNEVWPSVLAADTPYEPSIAGRPDGGGEVTLIRTEDGPESTARWVAARLAVPDPAWAASPTPPIAILLRARTRQAEYEVALRRYGVPYVVVGGVGLWSRPEVMDLVNAVAAVALADPVSVVGVLRGPLVGLPDAEVAPDPEHPALARWHALRHAVSPAVFVRRVADALVPPLAAVDPSPRAAANLALVAEQVDRWPDLSLAAVAERLLAQVDDDARAAEASLVPAEARVVLCTVHAAKGLEFPVVVVPELHTRPRGEVGPLLVARASAEARFDLASRVLDPEAPIETRAEPGRFATLLDASRAAADAEDRRLLYVAATRARDELVLVGAMQDPAEPGARGTWMQRLAAATPRATRVIDRVAEPPPLPPPPPPPPLPLLPPLPTRRALELSASALDRFVSCPARFARSEWLGLPEAPASARERAEALAAARGRVVHQALQDRVHTDPGAVSRRWRAEAGGLGATPDEVADGGATLAAHLAVTAADPGVGAMLAAPGRSEVPFRAAHAGVVLYGRIDWLYRSADGFVVVDWKSEALDGRSADAVAAKHATQLVAYGWAADRALRAAGELGVVRGAVVATEVGRAVDVPLWPAIDGVPRLLEEIAATAELGWAELERRATAGAARPCASCGYRGRGCRGA